MGVPSGFIAPEEFDSAFEEQRVDEAIGQKKPLCAYLFDAGKLTKLQIAKMLSSVKEK